MPTLIGQSLGRYQILEQLGEGGMATVYKAYDTRLERFVAIKVIRTDQFAPAMLEEMMRRFEREAKALAKLSHPSIVHVNDYGEYEGAPYLVMEYLPGGTLKLLPDTPMPWQQALRSLLPIAEALAYAHEHNIVHRDIKPGNILLTEKGLPMLTDFGIAKILESKDGATLTGAGMTIGTPEYMAPEQWTGESGPQSDIYSLAVVLYELITGRKPFTADTPVGIMLKQVNGPLPRPSQFVPDLPVEVENVLLKALERQPQNRYQTMSEFVTALETLVFGQTLPFAVKVEESQAGKTLLASGMPGPVTRPPTPPEGLASKPASGPGSAIQAPPEGHPQGTPKKGLRWVLLAGLAVVLCIGVVAGAGLLIKGAGGRGLLAGLLPSAARSTLTTVPSQVNSQTQANPQPSLSSLTPALTAPAPAAGVKVLWDISHGPRSSDAGSPYTPDGMYKALAQALGDQNFSITSGDLTNLDSVDILVVSELSGSTPYTAAEVDKIEQFVRVSGHGLLILSDIPSYENLADVVTRRFSIGLGESVSDGPASNSNKPFFSGVNTVQFIAGGGTFDVSSPSQTASWDKNGNSVVAFCECDAGRVMAISDANLWDNSGLNQADNGRFALNVFKWLAKLSP